MLPSPWPGPWSLIRLPPPNSWLGKACLQLQIASPRLRVCVDVVLVELVAVAVLVVLVVAWLRGHSVEAEGLYVGTTQGNNSVLTDDSDRNPKRRPIDYRPP